MKTNRPLAAVVLVILALAAVAVRWEDWAYQDERGGVVFQYRGVLLPWQEAQAPPPGSAVASVAVHKRTMLGFNRFDYVGPPAGVAPATGVALRSPGR